MEKQWGKTHKEGYGSYRTNAYSSDNVSEEEVIHVQEDFPIGDPLLQFSSPSGEFMEAATSSVDIVSREPINPKDPPSQSSPTPGYRESPGSVKIGEN
jgi:hypothetical protein